MALELLVLARISHIRPSLFCRVWLVQIDTNSSVKRENAAGNASLSQLLLNSPFGSSDSARFTANDVLGQPNTHTADMGSSAASAGQVRK